MTEQLRARLALNMHGGSLYFTLSSQSCSVNRMATPEATHTQAVARDPAAMLVTFSNHPKHLDGHYLYTDFYGFEKEFGSPPSPILGRPSPAVFEVRSVLNAKAC